MKNGCSRNRFSETYQHSNSSQRQSSPLEQAMQEITSVTSSDPQVSSNYQSSCIQQQPSWVPSNFLFLLLYLTTVSCQRYIPLHRIIQLRLTRVALLLHYRYLSNNLLSLLIRFSNVKSPAKTFSPIRQQYVMLLKFLNSRFKDKYINMVPCNIRIVILRLPTVLPRLSKRLPFQLAKFLIILHELTAVCFHLKKLCIRSVLYLLQVAPQLFHPYHNLLLGSSN